MLDVILAVVEVLIRILRWAFALLRDLAWIQGTEILLTAVLVVLYWQQKKILQSGEESEVHIEGYRGGEEGWGSPDSYLQVKLSNIGGGIATDFRVTFEINYEGDHTPLERTQQLSRNTGGQKEWIRGSGDYLESGERDKIFHSMLIIEWFDTESEGRRGSSIPHCIEGLAEEGVDKFELTARIHYTDQLGQEHKQFLFHYTNIPTDKAIETVNELLLNGVNPHSPDVHDYVLPPDMKLRNGGFVDVSEEGG